MSGPSGNARNVADTVAQRLASSGVRRAFGVPGGGSTNALVSALIRVGIEFKLTHTETGAAFMASVEAELSGRPGVALATLGPGAASLVNGLAHCRLDRAPVVAITDRLPEGANKPGYHQRLDHGQLLSGVVKESAEITAQNASATVDSALRLAASHPPGPVHLDLPVDVVREPAGNDEFASPVEKTLAPPDDESLERARELLAGARRPMILAGLGLRNAGVENLASVAETLRAPVLTTYKGKGAIDEAEAWSAGLITGGAAERSLLDRADLILTVGLDAVELIAGKPIETPRIPLSEIPEKPGYFPSPLVEVVGSLGTSVAAMKVSGASEWKPPDAVEHRRRVDEALAGCAPLSERGMHPWEVAAVVSERLGGEAAVAVDAGAHMFPVAQAWRAGGWGEFWISNGLSTMGYALPAAIALSLNRPDSPVACMTGDGGLAMVAGELATAARFGGRLIVVVFDDASLSLIRIKQSDGDPEEGVAFPSPDWTKIAEGFGMASFRAETVEGLRGTLEEALEGDGPALISVRVDPSPYTEMMKVLRG